MKGSIESSSELLADLNDKPVGRFGIRKCITKAEDDNGHVTYSIREYIPRPLYGKPDRYVPGRGVNLSEDNLRELCKDMRRELYEIRHIEDRINILKAKMDRDAGEEEDEDEEDYEEPDDRCIEEKVQEVLEGHVDPDAICDFETELNCRLFGSYGQMTNDDGEHIIASVMSWHEEDSRHDLRVWTNKVTSRGSYEYTPEIDKGLQLDDIEAEVLCQKIEEMFPDLTEETGQYIEQDYDLKADTVDLNFNHEDRDIFAGIIKRQLAWHLEKNLLRSNRESDIGQREADIKTMRLRDLYRKVLNGERLTRKECKLLDDLLMNVVEGEYEDRFDTAERRKTEQFLYNSPSHELPGPKCLYMKSDMVQISLSRYECRTARLMLRHLKDDLYCDNPESDRLKRFVRHYNRWIAATSGRYDGVSTWDIDIDKEDEPKDFLEDLIEAFNLASEQ